MATEKKKQATQVIFDEHDSSKTDDTQAKTPDEEMVQLQPEEDPKAEARKAKQKLLTAALMAQGESMARKQGYASLAEAAESFPNPPNPDGFQRQDGNMSSITPKRIGKRLLKGVSGSGKPKRGRRSGKHVKR